MILQLVYFPFPKKKNQKNKEKSKILLFLFCFFYSIPTSFHFSVCLFLIFFRSFLSLLLCSSSLFSHLSECLPDYRSLLISCWAQKSEARPEFNIIVIELKALLEQIPTYAVQLSSPCFLLLLFFFLFFCFFFPLPFVFSFPFPFLFVFFFFILCFCFFFFQFIVDFFFQKSIHHFQDLSFSSFSLSSFSPSSFSFPFSFLFVFFLLFSLPSFLFIVNIVFRTLRN